MTLRYNLGANIEAEIQRLDSEIGFTILEVLVALVIFSLTSIALFQSLSSNFVVTERVTQTSTETVSYTHLTLPTIYSV